MGRNIIIVNLNISFILGYYLIYFYYLVNILINEFEITDPPYFCNEILLDQIELKMFIDPYSTIKEKFARMSF